MDKGRSINAAKNLSTAWLGQLSLMLAKFATRFVFIKILTVDYLGLDGLFASLLTMLSLAELGVGNAINFSLYKPIANNDGEKIKNIDDLLQKGLYNHRHCYSGDWNGVNTSYRFFY